MNQKTNPDSLRAEENPLTRDEMIQIINNFAQQHDIKPIVVRVRLAGALKICNLDIHPPTLTELRGVLDEWALEIKVAQAQKAAEQNAAPEQPTATPAVQEPIKVPTPEQPGSIPDAFAGLAALTGEHFQDVDAEQFVTDQRGEDDPPPSANDPGETDQSSDPGLPVRAMRASTEWSDRDRVAFVLCYPVDQIPNFISEMTPAQLRLALSTEREGKNRKAVIALFERAVTEEKPTTSSSESPDLEKYFTEPLHREHFANWLNEHGVDTGGWWNVGRESSITPALDLGPSGKISLRFVGSYAQLIGTDLPVTQADQIYDLVETYSKQIAQQQEPTAVPETATPATPPEKPFRDPWAPETEESRIACVLSYPVSQIKSFLDGDEWTLDKLNRMLEVELANKNRKTVIAAIGGAIQVLKLAAEKQADAKPESNEQPTPVAASTEAAKNPQVISAAEHNERIEALCREVKALRQERNSLKAQIANLDQRRARMLRQAARLRHTIAEMRAAALDIPAIDLPDQVDGSTDEIAPAREGDDQAQSGASPQAEVLPPLPSDDPLASPVLA